MRSTRRGAMLPCFLVKERVSIMFKFDTSEGEQFERRRQSGVQRLRRISYTTNEIFMHFRI